MNNVWYESSRLEVMQQNVRPPGSRPPPVQPADAEREEKRAAAPPFWILPPLVSLAIQLWGLGRPAYSRDEAATLSAVERPFGALVRMLHNVDVAHGTYYSIIWLVVRLSDTGEVATRLPSAIATAVTAAVVYGLGKRLVSPRAGLAAGLVFAVTPLISYWGQTARPYAMETALAALASYLLVRAMQAAASGRKTYLLVIAGYGLCLTALGFMQYIGLLLAAVHLAPVVRTWLRHRHGKGLGLAVGWLAAVLAAFAIVSPVIRLGLAQRGTGTSHVNFAFFKSLIGLIGTPAMAEVAGVAVLCAIAADGFRGRMRLRENWPGDLIALCVPWLTLPPLILIFESHGTPLYNRYLLFCAPAAALLLGAALAALGWAAGAAVLVIFALLSVPSMLHLRAPDGHGGADIVAADQIIARDMRPGDSLLYLSINEPIQVVYPYGMQQLGNIDVGESPSASGTLGGLRAPWLVVLRRENTARRMWIVEINAHGAFRANYKPFPRGIHYRHVRTWEFDTLLLFLYVRQSTPAR